MILLDLEGIAQKDTSQISYINTRRAPSIGSQVAQTAWQVPLYGMGLGLALQTEPHFSPDSTDGVRGIRKISQVKGKKHLHNYMKNPVFPLRHFWPKEGETAQAQGVSYIYPASKRGRRKTKFSQKHT